MFEGIFVQAFFHELEHLSAREHGIFDGFAQTAFPFRLGEGGKKVDVAHHRAGRIYPARQVFAGFEVHGGLAAHGGIYGGKQSGGHLDVGYPPHIYARRKAREVSDDPAAESDQHVVAAQSVRREAFQKLPQKFPVFALFAVRYDISQSALWQYVKQFLQVQGSHVVIRDHGGFRDVREDAGKL